MSLEKLIVSARFCGPPKSGNGGYVCGRIAAHVAGAISVRLKLPPPLETELSIERSGSTVRLLDGPIAIAEAKPAVLDLEPPAAPALAAAQEASKAFSGFDRHSFPRCFVCGPHRTPGDGLRIFPGPIPSSSLVAAPWVPDASLADCSGNVGAEFVWSALDCTGFFALPMVPEGVANVLGELSLRIDGVVAPNENCVVVGWPLRIDGRKRFAGSALYSQAGRCVAVGSATWIEVAANAFGGV
jgi:hypothetical protein